MGAENSLLDKVLIQKLKKGDKSAFSFLFSAYYSDLVHFANTYNNDLIISEEIVQDVFVKLWENHESLHIENSVRSYLLKTVQNKCIDRIRHLKVRDKFTSYINENHILSENSTENYLFRSELQDHIEKAINMLSDDAAEVFRMSRYDGLKYHEIAKQLNISVRTVEVRMAKALHMLRDYLKDYW